jgi:predicted dithiol-disulfide oxidoreductase (DUF899 family)
LDRLIGEDDTPSPTVFVSTSRSGCLALVSPKRRLPAPTTTAFVLDDGVVHHAYSTQGRGVEFLMGYYPILDRAPRGRDEGDSRAPASLLWIRRHDEY